MSIKMILKYIHSIFILKQRVCKQRYSHDMSLFIMGQANSVTETSESFTRFLSREIFHRIYEIGPTYKHITYLIGNVRVLQNVGAFA